MATIPQGLTNSKRYYFLGLCIAAFVASALFAVGFGSGYLLRTSYNRSLRITPKDIDLHLVQAGEIVELSLCVQNGDTTSHRIVGARSECGCVSPEELPIVVNAGQDKDVKVKIHAPRDVPGPTKIRFKLELICERLGWLPPIWITCDVTPRTSNPDGLRLAPIPR